MGTLSQSSATIVLTEPDITSSHRDSTIPYRRDFEQLYWFKLLKFMLFVQLLFLSGNVMTMRNVVDMARWSIVLIALYLPISLFLFVALLIPFSSVKPLYSWIWMLTLLIGSSVAYYWGGSIFGPFFSFMG